MHNSIMYRFFSLLFSALALLLCSCRFGSTGSGSGAGDTVKFRYAEHINAVRHDGYTVVTLANPWKRGSDLHRYILVSRADSSRVGSLPHGTVVYTPVARGVVFTAPHCYLLGVLGAKSVVKGVCDLAYMNLPYVHDAVKRGLVSDCGNSMSPSVERIVALRPEAIFVSPFDGASYGQIARLGVPIVECADYMETSALGRAEWMRFYGMLVGREHEADSLFAVVEREYCSARKKALKSHTRPKVITERVVSGVWYCPGGRSSMGRLIADAGGRYVFADDSHSGSLTLSPEVVVDKANDADCWLFVGSGVGTAGRRQLLSEYAGYKMIKAFRSGSIYECVPSMGNEYFEEISFRPDFLLKNLVEMFHPDVKCDADRHYYNVVRE